VGQKVVFSASYGVADCPEDGEDQTDQKHDPERPENRYCCNESNDEQNEPEYDDGVSSAIHL
jgi:hypothetical protein